MSARFKIMLMVGGGALLIGMSGCVSFHSTFDVPVKVTNAKTQEPIEDVMVTAHAHYFLCLNPPPATEMRTDYFGKAVVKGNTAFMTSIQVHKAGYESPEQWIVIGTAAREEPVRIELSPE